MQKPEINQRKNTTLAQTPPYTLQVYHPVYPPPSASRRVSASNDLGIANGRSRCLAFLHLCYLHLRLAPDAAPDIL